MGTLPRSSQRRLRRNMSRTHIPMRRDGPCGHRRPRIITGGARARLWRRARPSAGLDVLREPAQHNPAGSADPERAGALRRTVARQRPLRGLVHRRHSARGAGRRRCPRVGRVGRRSDAGPRRLQPAVPRLRAIFGRGCRRHRGLRGLDRRLRCRHRRSRGHGHPRARRSRDHPLLHHLRGLDGVVPAG